MRFSEEGLLATYKFRSSQPILIDVGVHLYEGAWLRHLCL